MLVAVLEENGVYVLLRSLLTRERREMGGN